MSQPRPPAYSDGEVAKDILWHLPTARALQDTTSKIEEEGKPLETPQDKLSKIAAVRLPDRPPSTLWDVSISDGKISSVDAHDTESSKSSNRQTPPDILDGCNRLLAPSLCHAHIHLDKCFLLQDPKFSDLQIEKGDFQEAMEMTGKAKARFEEDDLLRRGRQLIEESVRHGVTAMRAFVEVDGVVLSKCLDAGLKLKKEYEHQCDVQICAFAQLPLFSGEDGGETVRRLMAEAAQREGVDVLGSTPYVEEDNAKARLNIWWIMQWALALDLHLDLHLDYFLDESKQPLVFNVLETLGELDWVRKSGKRVTLGHCTRLTHFKDSDWLRLKQEIETTGTGLPVSFVGLPTSDLFIMGKTLPIIEMITKYGLDAAIAVNNVGNAFTPHGNCDPLSIACLGVGLYQAGKQKDAELLYEAVSTRAKAAIGCTSSSLALTAGDPADFVLFDSMDASWRCRKSIVEVVYDAGTSRQTVFRGRLTAS